MTMITSMSAYSGRSARIRHSRASPLTVRRRPAYNAQPRSTLRLTLMRSARNESRSEARSLLNPGKLIMSTGLMGSSMLGVIGTGTQPCLCGEVA